MKIGIYNSKKRIENIYTYLFIAGIILGIFLWYIGKFNVFDREFLIRLSSIQIPEGDLFLYLLKSRLSIFLMIVLSVTMVYGRYLLDGILIWMGTTLGFLLGNTIGVYGIRGILLLLAGFFPQGILYIPCFFYAFRLAVRTCRKMYTSNAGEPRIAAKRILRPYALWMLILAILIGIGCLVECLYNPAFMKMLLSGELIF